MTANQINYWKLQEERRSNRAKESETVRHNERAESLESQSIHESQRHNIATESENYRHNWATEDYQRAGVAESARHNKAVESETGRHNKETETTAWFTYLNANNEFRERERHNLATEANEANKIATGFATDVLKLNEDHRHNVALETEQHRANSIKLADVVVGGLVDFGGMIAKGADVLTKVLPLLGG